MKPYPHRKIDIILFQNYDFVTMEMIEPTEATIPLYCEMPEIVVFKGYVYKQVSHSLLGCIRYVKCNEIIKAKTRFRRCFHLR